MTDFFDRLLARRQPLDEPGAVIRARPRVPTLFERSRGRDLEEISLERTAASPPAVAAPPPSVVPPAPALRTPPPAAPPPVGRFEAPATEPGPATVSDPSVSSPQPAPPALTPPAVIHPPLLPPPVASRVESASIPVPVAAPITAAPQLIAPATPWVAPAMPMTTPAAPGTAAAPDGRTRRAEPPGRTVRVHIGRIEISVPPGPQTKPERAKRRAPELTLDKYLGEGTAP